MTLEERLNAKAIRNHWQSNVDYVKLNDVLDILKNYEPYTEMFKHKQENVCIPRRQLKDKLKDVEFSLKNSPTAPYFLGLQDLLKELLGINK